MPRAMDLRRVRYSPITRPYQALAAFSFEIAMKRGNLVSAESDDVSGILVDVAELWELFLVHCAELAFGSARVEHGTTESDSSFLLTSASKEGTRMGRLKPDILIRNAAGDLIAVIDAKYKRLQSWAGSPHGVDRGDLYQLTSYLMGHPEVDRGILAYPENEGDRALAVEGGPWRTSLGHRVSFERFAARSEAATRQMKHCLELV